MKKKMIVLTTLATLALTTTACTQSDENTIETGDTTTNSTENTGTENGDVKVDVGDKEQAVSTLNLFLGTMGMNGSYQEQSTVGKDNELATIMSQNEDFDKVVSLVRSGDVVYMEPVNYENMSDNEIYDYIKANYLNAALTAQSQATSGNIEDYVVTVDDFHMLNNGDMLFLDYPVEMFLANENISSVEEYDIDTDNDKDDIVMEKVGDKWKIHEAFIKNYIEKMRSLDL